MNRETLRRWKKEATRSSNLIKGVNVAATSLEAFLAATNGKTLSPTEEMELAKKCMYEAKAIAQSDAKATALATKH